MEVASQTLESDHEAEQEFDEEDEDVVISFFIYQSIIFEYLSMEMPFF